MTQAPKRASYRIPAMRFTNTQRGRHVARMIAPADEGKQSLIRGLPLFEIAVYGGDALRPWSKKGKAA